MKSRHEYRIVKEISNEDRKVNVNRKGANQNIAGIITTQPSGDAALTY
jgi:hypothetical protein